jgi:hypothetical protein
MLFQIQSALRECLYAQRILEIGVAKKKKYFLYYFLDQEKASLGFLSGTYQKNLLAFLFVDQQVDIT